MVCVRCGSEKDLEEDHIIPKIKGGTDDESNKRWLCSPCHDYRHTRDNIIKSINNQLHMLGTRHYNSVRFSMLIMRLGILEAFNTPEKIRERGTYMSYWEVPKTHYSAWYPQIKLAKLNRQARLDEQKVQSKLLEN